MLSSTLRSKLFVQMHELCNLWRSIDGVGYVICRLPNNHEGHNVHYWTGPGSSPYSNYCRRSINYNRPDFVMETCNCSHCSPFNGLKLCKNLECYNRCENPEMFSVKIVYKFDLKLLHIIVYKVRRQTYSSLTMNTNGLNPYHNETIEVGIGRRG